MLVLTRKVGESIIIGHDVELMVLDIEGDHIKVGIKAPRSVPIYRSELWAEIQRENALAANRSTAMDVALAALADSQVPPVASGESARPSTVRLRK